MRLRKKPWVSEAIKEYEHFVLRQPDGSVKGCWDSLFGRTAPLHVELGTGKGNFIAGMAEKYPEDNFIGIEAQQDVLYYAAQKIQNRGLTNVRLLVFDINNILELFAAREVNRFYINFCDPWPKQRHAKRRLTHANFLEKYQQLLIAGGNVFFKTDNQKLFEFSLNELCDNNWKLSHITLDLHNSSYQGNVMTEYEAKFSALGQKIYRLEAALR